jgi:hypothetical protein
MVRTKEELINALKGLLVRMTVTTLFHYLRMYLIRSQILKLRYQTPKTGRRNLRRMIKHGERSTLTDFPHQ